MLVYPSRACQELLKCGCKMRVQEMQVCEIKPTMHKPVLLFGTVYQRLDDQTCITAFVAYIWCYVWIYYSYTKVMVVFIISHSQQWCRNLYICISVIHINGDGSFTL